MVVGPPSGFTQWDVLDGVDELAAWLLDKGGPSVPGNQALFERHLNEIRSLVQVVADLVDRGKDLPERDRPRSTQEVMRIRYSAKVTDPC